MIPFLVEGEKAVCVFAALNGFLIYRSLREKELNRGTLVRYFTARFWRIYPLYMATVIAFALSGSMRRDPTLLHGLLSEFLMLQVFGFPYEANLPSWSLYVEVAFYLTLPLLLAVGKTWCVGGAAVLAGAVFLWAMELFANFN
jgi:peptidoglycan/LPS O-acetylase OafA/YrhL